MSPIYDYFCPKCKIRVSDILVSAFGEPQYCQKCGAKLKKLPSAPNLKFVGDGFFKTDYNDDNKEKE